MKNKTVFAKCLMLAVLMSLLMSLTLPVTTMADSRVVRETDYSDKFRVTIYWTVDNNHKDQGNYIKLYYYKPTEEGYFWNNKGEEYIYQTCPGC